MNKKSEQNKSSKLVDKLLSFFKNMPNLKKKGDLSEMILRDDFHNKNQTEDDYQKEQEEWLNRVKKKKEGKRD